MTLLSVFPMINITEYSSFYFSRSLSSASAYRQQKGATHRSRRHSFLSRCKRFWDYTSQVGGCSRVVMLSCLMVHRYGGRVVYYSTAGTAGTTATTGNLTGSREKRRTTDGSIDHASGRVGCRKCDLLSGFLIYYPTVSLGQMNQVENGITSSNSLSISLIYIISHGTSITRWILIFI